MFEDIADLVDKIQHAATRVPRLIIGIAGAPGAGKSTFAATLRTKLGESAIVIPQDGFHLDNAILSARGQLGQKGSAHTFDTLGLSTLLSQVRSHNEAIYFPVFNRDEDIAHACAGVVLPHHKIILVEGNYLFLESDGWSEITGHFDMTIALVADKTILKQRLMARWLGLGLSQADAEAKVGLNDLPNGELVAKSLARADITVGVWKLPDA